MAWVSPFRAVCVINDGLHWEVIYMKHAALVTDRSSVLGQREKEKEGKHPLQMKGSFLCCAMSTHNKSPSLPHHLGPKCVPPYSLSYCIEVSVFTQV